MYLQGQFPDHGRPDNVGWNPRKQGKKDCKSNCRQMLSMHSLRYHKRKGIKRSLVRLLRTAVNSKLFPRLLYLIKVVT